MEGKSRKCLEANVVRAGEVRTGLNPAPCLLQSTYSLLMTLFELARNPKVQQALRQEILEYETAISEKPQRIISELPLLQATLKEILRLYPVGVTLDRVLTSDVVLHNYHIPAGTLVMLSLYSLGRSPTTFTRPERYHPQHWLERKEPSSRLFSLMFSFGLCQCVGRHLANTEILLLAETFLLEKIMHMNPKMVFHFMLMPSTFPLLTLKAIKEMVSIVWWLQVTNGENLEEEGTLAKHNLMIK
ncbi:cytochrome P450 11B1, mitochondrial-like [Erinaceus europaeus]|uniref:Cytochrome P450 11B1, mitochondrial-like n=1 Tax=Erinaceus europaeus TaxID=9365 RepID=A0ABM3XSG2_ERIEU|nr:cytochrome P450 11B1, mitochondrial-like [Erinaceus europaeus]